jgi:hypothetical protein
MPRIHLSLSADLIQKCELLEQARKERVVNGRPVDLNYKLVLRRAEGDPEEVPVVSAAPWEVSYSGHVESREDQPGIIETTREIVLKVPAILKVGYQRGNIRVRWLNGRVEDKTVDFEVTPSLVIKPYAIVLEAPGGPVSRTILLRSDDHPFRVHGVKGAVVQDFHAMPNEASLEHVISLKLDSSRAQGSATSVEFVTDHPLHPVVSLSVIIPR